MHVRKLAHANVFHFLVFLHYQSLHQNRVHLCNILATFFDILEIKITNH